MIDSWDLRIRAATVEIVAQSFNQAFLSIVKGSGSHSALGGIDIITP